MPHNARPRILQFLQLARCSYRVEGQQIITQNAVITLAEQHISIARQGKPLRTMPYQRLNLDRLLSLITAQAERKNLA